MNFKLLLLAFSGIMAVSYNVDVFAQQSDPVLDSTILWEAGDIQWLDTVYFSDGTGVVRVTDPDMNMIHGEIENFDVDVWSDTDLAGIDLTVTETEMSSGVFEGAVFFSTTDNSSGHRLHVSHGDTIYSKYVDTTIPKSNYDDVSVFVNTALIKIDTVPKIEDRVSLDKEFYQWGDDVLVSITAPELNTDLDLVEEISNSEDSPVEINTRHFKIKEFTLVETGMDTGIFSGKISLSTENLPSVHQTDHDRDGISVSFEYREDLVSIASAQIGPTKSQENSDKQNCDSGILLPGGGCQMIKEEKVNTIEDDASSFDIFVYFENFISWIFG